MKTKAKLTLHINITQYLLKLKTKHTDLCLYLANNATDAACK